VYEVHASMIFSSAAPLETAYGRTCTCSTSGEISARSQRDLDGDLDYRTHSYHPTISSQPLPPPLPAPAYRLAAARACLASSDISTG
jgi:hypothetical protein